MKSMFLYKQEIITSFLLFADATNVFYSGNDLCILSGCVSLPDYVDNQTQNCNILDNLPLSCFDLWLIVFVDYSNFRIHIRFLFEQKVMLLKS